jgi:hypothetical protein
MKRWKNTKNIGKHFIPNINGNKLKTYRKLKEKFVTDTYLFLDIDKTLIKQFTQIKIGTCNSKLMIELGRQTILDLRMTK